MSDAQEYRENAAQCRDLADGTQSLSEREQWLRMEQSWLVLAKNADDQDSYQHRMYAPR